MDVHSMMHEALPYHTYHTVVSSGISQPKVDRRTRKSPRAAVAARLSLRSGTESVVAALWLWDTVRSFEGASRFANRPRNVKNWTCFPTADAYDVTLPKVGLAP